MISKPILAALVAIVGGPAQVTENPAWLTPPVVEDYPEFAGLIQMSGVVELTCYAVDVGPPVDCRVTSATPEGMGFEPLALRAAETGRIRPRYENGQVVRSSVTFAVRFSDEVFLRSTFPKPTEEELTIAREIAGRTLVPVPMPGNQGITVDTAEDRREEVQGWLDELMPTGEAEQREANAQVLAQILSLEELREFRAGRQVQPDLPEGSVVVATTPAREAAAAEIKRRYCARYDCRQPEWAEPAP